MTSIQNSISFKKQHDSNYLQRHQSVLRSRSSNLFAALKAINSRGVQGYNDGPDCNAAPTTFRSALLIDIIWWPWQWISLACERSACSGRAPKLLTKSFHLGSTGFGGTSTVVQCYIKSRESMAQSNSILRQILVKFYKKLNTTINFKIV